MIPVTGFPLGGTALFINNIELRMPPPTLPFFQDNISFAIFHDAGNVFTNGHDLFHNLLRWSPEESRALPAGGHREPVRLQLHFACHRCRGALQDAGGPGALRFRIQSESARVPGPETITVNDVTRPSSIPSTRAISTFSSALDRLSDGTQRTSPSLVCTVAFLDARCPRPAPAK